MLPADERRLSPLPDRPARRDTPRIAARRPSTEVTLSILDATRETAADRYRRDGFLTPLSVFDPVRARTCADEIRSLSAGAGPALDVPWHQKTHLLLPCLDDLARDPALTDLVAELLGPDLVVLSADVFIKEPRSSRRITWHQDVNYWELEPLEVLTAWIALTSATTENGCVQYAAGRHAERIDHVERPDADNMLSRGQEIAVEVTDDETTDVVLAPGQVSFHHALTPHASGPNRSDAHRIGLAIRYAPPSIVQLAGPPISARLVRGIDMWHNFELEEPPDTALSARAIAAHSRALSPHTATGYSTV